MWRVLVLDGVTRQFNPKYADGFKFKFVSYTKKCPDFIRFVTVEVVQSHFMTFSFKLINTNYLSVWLELFGQGLGVQDNKVQNREQ